LGLYVWPLHKVREVEYPRRVSARQSRASADREQRPDQGRTQQ